MDGVLNHIQELKDRLAKIESVLQDLVQKQTVKDWYATDEVARLVGKAEFLDADNLTLKCSNTLIVNGEIFSCECRKAPKHPDKEPSHIKII